MNSSPTGRPGWQFPDPEMARPDGLLAFGGDLEPATLLQAYSLGIFPWYNEGEPILWHAPNPRCVLFPADFTISKRSLRKIRNSNFTFSFDRAFSQVLVGCAAPRPKQSGTWLIPEMQAAYLNLHLLGFAHSVEIWQQDKLVGGLYGLCLGATFFGESMFRKVSEASRAALVCLIELMRRLGFHLLDCQQATPHMLAMGARELPRWEFRDRIKRGMRKPWPIPKTGDWRYLEEIVDGAANVKKRKHAAEE